MLLTTEYTSDQRCSIDPLVCNTEVVALTIKYQTPQLQYIYVNHLLRIVVGIGSNLNLSEPTREIEARMNRNYKTT